MKHLPSGFKDLWRMGDRKFVKASNSEWLQGNSVIQIKQDWHTYELTETMIACTDPHRLKPDKILALRRGSRHRFSLLTKSPYSGVSWSTQDELCDFHLFTFGGGLFCFVWVFFFVLLGFVYLIFIFGNLLLWREKWREGILGDHEVGWVGKWRGSRRH